MTKGMRFTEANCVELRQQILEGDLDYASSASSAASPFPSPMPSPRCAPVARRKRQPHRLWTIWNPKKRKGAFACGQLLRAIVPVD
ncbi:hypothetical protein, partial [Adlercreutzia sp. DFI.6.23]|uniref:hypothetical protein n=1 Tax=Adlercreutzia sp. DFI.6.23 TaxID=2963705 RepID=UPI002108C15C